MYASKDFYPHHRASHSHGQLRNVLAARSRNDVFYASKSRVMHTSLSCPAYTDVVVNFSGASTNPNQAGDAHVTTIAVSPATDFEGYCSDAVLVTGGLEGEYSLLNLNSALGDRPTEGFVTVAEQKETTHVHILGHRRTGALGAAFCSNDSKVRLLDIDSNSWSAEFAYEHQINCAATSPDGRLRMIVGDSCESLITDAERGNVLFSMQQHTGYGFACAWAADGWHVATGSEDGKVVVYDARRWDVPLANLSCEMSCARSLHFTASNRGGASLVVAESDDIVSVYDAMNWCDKQTIDFFGSVVGAVSVDNGHELIVANGDETVGGLMVFERRSHIPDELDDPDQVPRDQHGSGLSFDDLMLQGLRYGK
ncbi:WD40 repeat-like protein [Aureobasidium namibiae CBS 147.97]|uniref:WD40 repeat-like protein n=1 Tax=Aureobasidium namibiae CBS 147.97 TaxID=1043004 RepID=A0A074X528_9PEZI|nr:WD40 repeat-like protein [Aureobasidium namibiae CBS 147.97]KEQ77132.1 WD40 repeat-like protein [Aureobasidium namibiae CBS 147.97]